MQFPARIKQGKMNYLRIDKKLNKPELKQLFVRNPYEVYAVVDESIEENEEILSTFQVLHSNEFQENVILYDVSNQPHSTVTTNIQFLVKGYIELIDVGIVDRFPVKFYVKEYLHENI
ncbi:hypothetical protein ACIGEL_17735 [Rossellomorea aquimaris]|uniref:hypothetical protein n=1 Tax=Rossellomorea aquimaris TaxID=189382 RepID=UPI0037CBC88E